MKMATAATRWIGYVESNVLNGLFHGFGFCSLAYHSGVLRQAANTKCGRTLRTPFFVGDIIG
ncbi:MAG: hypothetical protein PHE53_08440 [Thermoguttaceae bacterium]|nr:hypothetical protein [Thermoguttaceae bacterium]